MKRFFTHTLLAVLTVTVSLPADDALAAGGRGALSKMPHEVSPSANSNGIPVRCFFGAYGNGIGASNIVVDDSLKIGVSP